jgi:hypothetical protein
VAFSIFSLLLAIVHFAAESTLATRLLVGCLGLACITGILALVFYFTEEPTEITVHRWPDEPPLIH